ncbi:annexin B9-like [Neocloeon triangulifer]|uniref:annexin B9-like n=1 Tax=Neocloeon triangulifer TaxID=2078957 RepID=UPI00286F1FC8|nr:annexin B9-like [Neocloeon triangulifer]
MFPHRTESMPTVFPKRLYTYDMAEDDALTLKEALKGILIDDKRIINILTNRSAEQRQMIAEKYMSCYSTNLVDDLRALLVSSDFASTLVAWMTPLPRFYARELRYAITGFRNHNDEICEILCSLNVNNLLAVKTAYLESFGKTVEADIEDQNFPPQFKQFILSLCKCFRNESDTLNAAKISNDADAIYIACNRDFEASESDVQVVSEILTMRSLSHLRELSEEFHALFGKDIEKVVKDSFAPPIKDAFVAMLNFACDSDGFFAERLYNSMVGLGTRDRDLIRLIVTRAEIDLSGIKVAFLHMYGKTLESFIEGDCSGVYKKLLLALATPSVLKTG